MPAGVHVARAAPAGPRCGGAAGAARQRMASESEHRSLLRPLLSCDELDDAPADVARARAMRRAMRVRRLVSPAERRAGALALVTSGALVTFALLHVWKADGDAALPWSLVLLPAGLAGLGAVGLALHHTPRTAASVALLSLAAAGAVVRESAMARARAGGREVGGTLWAPVAVPLALVLLIHLLAALRCHRRASAAAERAPAAAVTPAVISLAQVALAAISLLLLSLRLSAAAPSISWRAIVAPYAAGLLGALGAGGAASCDRAAVRAPVGAPDPVDAVMRREGASYHHGVTLAIEALLQLWLLWSIASQLDAERAPDAPPPSWASTYSPFALVLAVPLCCAACCTRLPHAPDRPTLPYRCEALGEETPGRPSGAEAYVRPDGYVAHP